MNTGRNLDDNKRMVQLALDVKLPFQKEIVFRIERRVEHQ